MATKKELEQELNELRAQNEQLLKEAEITDIPLPDGIGNFAANYLSEVSKIQQKAKVDSDKITVQEFTDHKNISLWTPLGKRIGPLHRSNALRTLDLFHRLGRQLSTDRPTPEQIEAYKKTAHYKKDLEAQAKKQAARDKSRTSRGTDKLVKAIAEMSGQTIEAIQNIYKPGQELSIKEGRAKAGIE